MIPATRRQFRINPIKWLVIFIFFFYFNRDLQNLDVFPVILHSGKRTEGQTSGSVKRIEK